MEELKELLELDETVMFESFEELSESDKPKGILLHIKKAPMIVADKENKNSRIYPEEAITSGLEKFKKKLKENPIASQLEHGNGDTFVRLNKVSHIISSVQYDKDSKTAFCDLAILKTGAGRDVKALLDSGVKMGLSVRGSGVVGADGKVSGWSLEGVDIVGHPSFGDDVDLSRGRVFESCDNAILEEEIIEGRYWHARKAGFMGTKQEYRELYLKEREK